MHACFKGDIVPLNLAEQDGADAIDPGGEIDTSTRRTNSPQRSCTKQDSWYSVLEGSVRSHKGGRRGVDKSAEGKVSSHVCRRVASRARICGILVEKGARRTWRRIPSESQVALDKKYAALLKDDDGRRFSTFSG